ncbi:MAG: hypothetical protein J6A89_04415 [Clostridia bacterium]|nr:hypothetical protein [Clostridia bacterium]
MKKIIINPKITAIIGLIGGMIMLISSIVSNFTYNNVYPEIFIILENIFKIGLILYFGNIITRLYFGTGSLKFANYVLIATLIIFILHLTLVRNIIEAVVFLCILLYFINILFDKNTYINNKIFTLVFGGYSILSAIVLFMEINEFPNSLYLMINYISYLLVIPYFYGYYELKEEN